LHNPARWIRIFRDALFATFCLIALIATLPAAAQTINLFPADYEKQWTRITVPPGGRVSNVPQWHIDAKRRVIVCDGNGGHEWLRFNREIGNFTFHVKWRFTPVTTGTPKYNSGVFFRNNDDGAIWHQAQTGAGGGYIFGVTPVEGKPKSFNLRNEMKENRVKPAGQWNVYDIRCVGDNCTLEVNGMVVNTVKLSVMKGYVGLESEGYQITFKDLKLRELP